jgi:hypothetical protein
MTPEILNSAIFIKKKNRKMAYSRLPRRAGVRLLFI